MSNYGPSAANDRAASGNRAPAEIESTGSTPRAAAITTSRLTGHAALYATAGILGKAVALVTVPYLSRALGPGNYGLADLGSSFAAAVTLLVMCSADIPSMRLVARSPARSAPGIRSSYVAATAVISVIASLLLLPAGGLVATTLWASPADSALAVAAAVLIPISAVQAALVQVLRMADAARGFALAATVDLLAQTLLAVLFVAAGMGPMGVLIGLIVGSLIGVGAALVVARPYLTSTVDLRLGFRLLFEGLPFLPGVVAFVLADAASRAIAANVVGLSAVGQLALAIRVAGVLALGSAAFSMAWGPTALSMRPSPSTAATLGRMLRASVAVAAAGALTLSLIGPEVSRLLGGTRFGEASVAIPALALGSGLVAASYVLTAAAGIAYRGRVAFWASLSGASTQIVLTALLITPLGIVGFALGALVGRGVALIALVTWMRQVVHVSGSTIAILAAGVAGTAVAQALNASASGTAPWRIGLALMTATALVTAALISQRSRRDSGLTAQ